MTGRKNLPHALILGCLAASTVACDTGSTGYRKGGGGTPQSGLPTTRMQIGSRTFTR